ncbi:MAG TPA: hypothetical protein VK563_13590 [Puia sp.]|nr:hypothetical protein [Puia sp.]
MNKLILTASLIFIISIVNGQMINTTDLVGDWVFDKGKTLIEIDFKNDSIFRYNKPDDPDGKYSLLKIRNETVLTLEINTGGNGWEHEIYLIRRLPVVRFFILQVPKKDKKGKPIIEWQKHYGRDEYILTRINPEDRHLRLPPHGESNP